MKRESDRTKVLGGMAVMALVLGVYVFASVGCDKDDAVNCRSALTHFYDQGCILVVGGDPVSLEDAISGCEEERTYAQEAGCSSQHQSTLQCMKGIGAEQCTSCQSALDSYYNCLLGDPCPGYTGEDTTCCRVSDPCDWAMDGYCDCDGLCSWDSSDCG
jgi:hypothetical protein